MPRNRQGNLVWTGFELGTGNLLKRNLWFFHHITKCTDMLYVWSDFGYKINYGLLLIQLNGKIQTNFARVIYSLNGRFLLSH